MSAIHTGDLRAEGLNGIRTILEFRMEEVPGVHSTAMMACRVDTGKAAELLGEPVCDQTITIYRIGADRPVYSGMIRRGSVTEENGVQTMRLELVSGTIRMDLAKKDRSWQDTGMSYGALFRQVAARAGAGVLYPSYLDSRPLGTPRVQYQETDWEFLKRMASHFSLPLYSEPTGGGARISVGIPETGAPVELEWTEYTAVVEGSSHDRGRLLSYEVESREAHVCGERTAFQGRELTICGRTCESRKGELIFTYRLARPEWASQRRLSNEKLSGLSLLGTVLSGEEETLRLKLDIDRDHPDQNQGNEYPFPWRPATGNLMYLMPSKGSRVSLYFKNGDESSATAVNCIRQEGEGAENEYRKRSLRTEHQKELKLYPDRMGVISPEAHVLLDDLEGLSVRGRKSLKILSAGKVSVSGQTVTLNTGKGKLSVYHGHAEAEKDGTMVFVKDAEFHMKEDGMEADSLGERTCLCAYEKEDYSGNEYRFRDDPVEENYDCTGLAVTDLISRRVSSMEEYMKTALAGSVVGALTGAAELVPVSGLARVGVDFLAGTSGSAAGQLITEGEVDAERMFREGVLAAVMAAGARMLRESGKVEKVGLKYKFSLEADDHLNNFKGFNKRHGGIKGAHNIYSFREFERPIEVVGDIRYSHIDGIFEIDYKVAKIVRGKYEGWISNIYTKTLFDPDRVSIDELRKWAEEAFEDVTAIPIRENQLYIKGTASNGLKLEGWIDINTQEIVSYYPVLEWSN